MINGSKVILLVEDEADVRNYFAEVFSRDGFEILQAGDGNEACGLYRENADVIDAVVSDLRMPGMGGEELARFNYENRFFPFIVCTVVADARVSLKLLEYGVRDYIVKPVDHADLSSTVRNAINRRLFVRHLEDDEDPLEGNAGSITINSRQEELLRAMRWVYRKLDKKVKRSPINLFIAFFSEFLLNAHEHGNLRLSGEDKIRLLREGAFDEEIRKRERDCKAKISIQFSVVNNEVAAVITDDGFGFKHEHYLNLSDEYFLDHLDLPSGRGIFMASKWFDTISFSKGGASVLLIKKFNQIDLL